MNQDLTKTSETTADVLTVRPAYRTSETDEGITLDVGLPGVRKEDLEVTFHEGILTLGAKRTNEVAEDWKPVQEPVRPDRYELRVRLHSSLDPARTTAALADGVLRLTIAKKQEALPRRVEIN